MSMQALDVLKLAWPLFQRALEPESFKAPTTAELQGLLIEQLDALTTEWRAQGLSDEDGYLARFAICALIDEVILSKTAIGMEWFGYSLVMKYDQDFVAGESFFTKLSATKESSRLIQPIFLMCLFCGFRGKYQFGDQKEFEELQENLQKQCYAMLGSDASALQTFLPQGPGKLPKEKNGRGWFVVTAAIGVLSISLYCVLMMMAQS